MSVVETVNPESLLLAPPQQGGDSFADTLRWNAGLLLGSLDWLAERFLHYSLIAEFIVKPIAGDWTELEAGALAWGAAGSASRAVGVNVREGGLATTADWTGEASDAFRARVTELADGYDQYGEGCDMMAEVTAALVELCKAIADVLTLILSFISDLLTRLALELAVPVVGWVAGAVDVAMHIRPVARLCQQAYDALARWAPMLARVTQALRLLARIAAALTTLARLVATGARVSTVNDADGAARATFGVA